LAVLPVPDAGVCEALEELLLDAGDVLDALDDAGVAVSEAQKLYRGIENFMVQQGCPLPKAEEGD